MDICTNTSSNFEIAGVLLGKEVRKRKTPQKKKIAIIQQTMEPGMTVSHVARLHGIQPSLLFKGKTIPKEASLLLLPVKTLFLLELAAAIKQINQLQRLLGKKTMEVEILKEAVEYAQSRKWIACALVTFGQGIAPVSRVLACRVRS